MLRALGLLTLASFYVARDRFRRGPLLPTWSWAFEVSVRYLRLAWDRTADWEPARLRADVASRPYPRYAPRDVMIEDATLAGLPSRRCKPSRRASSSVVLYFHGGSYQYGSVFDTHAEILARLAESSGVEVVGVDYRLAPEHPFPAQKDDARAAFDALVASGVPADRIVLSGDSAGGNLTLVLAIALRDDGIAPRAVALISP